MISSAILEQHLFKKQFLGFITFEYESSMLRRREAQLKFSRVILHFYGLTPVGCCKIRYIILLPRFTSPIIPA